MGGSRSDGVAEDSVHSILAMSPISQICFKLGLNPSFWSDAFLGYHLGG